METSRSTTERLGSRSSHHTVLPPSASLGTEVTCHPHAFIFLLVPGRPFGDFNLVHRWHISGIPSPVSTGSSVWFLPTTGLYFKVLFSWYSVISCPLFTLTGALRADSILPVYTEGELKVHKERSKKLLPRVSNKDPWKCGCQLFLSQRLAEAEPGQSGKRLTGETQMEKEGQKSGRNGFSVTITRELRKRDPLSPIPTYS